MKTKVNKAFFLIPVFYAAVIIFLLYMQFSGSSAFYSEVSGISISGRNQAGAPGKGSTITELTIRSNGLIFSFGEENPALIFAQDGLTHRTVPQDYRVTASGIDIRLSKGLSVSFYRMQNDSGSLYISVSSEDPESIRFIHIPADGDDTVFSLIEGSQVVSVKSEAFGNYFLTLPEDCSFDTETGAIIIYPETGKTAELVLEKTAGAGLDAYSYWLNSGFEAVTDSELKQEIEAFISRSANALTGSRFNSTRGTWTMGEGPSAFDENALIMATVHNIGTSSYKRTMNLMNQAAASHSRELTIRSASLFGNIVNAGWAYEQNIDARTKSLTSLAQSGDYSVFSDTDLTAVILTEDSGELIGLISAMCDKSAESVDDIDTALMMLGFYHQITGIYPAIAGRFEGAAGLYDKLITPGIKVVAERLYIVDEDGKADILRTLKSGVFLMKSRAAADDEKIAAMGRELVRSAVLLADNNGMMPEVLTVTGEGTPVKSGVLTPETVYPLLTNNVYFPAADYFYDETGEKISVLNQASSFKMIETDFGYRLHFDFPAGQTHMFAVRNIEPFDQINLLGYKWNPDHRFLTYSSGWWFDKQHNTLFVKIRHRQTTEEILIYKARETPAPATAPADGTGEETPGTAEQN